MSTTAIQPAITDEQMERDKYNQWCAEGQRLTDLKNDLQTKQDHLQFAVGDWILQRETYQEAAQLTGYSIETLRNFAYVARHVPVSLRVVTLSWAIHSLIAPLKNEKDKRWVLELAVDNQLSVRKVKEYLDARKLTQHIKPTRNESEDLLRLSHKTVQEKYGEDVAIAQMRIKNWWKAAGIRDNYSLPDLWEAWSTIMPFSSKEKLDKNIALIREHSERLKAIADKLEMLPLSDNQHGCAKSVS
jgi:hypothetical protein